jgi:hypothetical protein
MSLNTVSTELIVLYAVVAILFFALVGYVAVLRSRQRRKKKNLAAISAALVDYFRRTGVEISVGCAESDDGKRFTAFIESEPMKRFRLSHIIEMTLRDHVAKACGLELAKVYWRFPIKQVDQSTAAVAAAPEKETKAPQDADDYINEGLVHYRDLPKFDVTEIPWEKFEEATFKDTAPPSDTASRRDGT